MKLLLMLLSHFRSAALGQLAIAASSEGNPHF